MKKLTMGISPVNKIFVGHVKNGRWEDRQEITDEAIRSVYEWFLNNAEKEKSGVYQIAYGDFGALTFRIDIDKEVK